MAAAPGSEGPDCNRTSAEHGVPKRACVRQRAGQCAASYATSTGAQRLRQRVFSREG